MGAGEVKFTADMEGAAALKEVQRLSKELGKLEKSFDKLAKSSKKGTTEKIKLDKQAMELDRQRKRVLEQIITPQEKFNKKMKELNVLVGRGKLTQDQYSRAVRQTQGELKKAEVSGKKAFGSGPIRQLAAMAAGVATVTKAVSVLKQAWDGVTAARQAAAGKQRAAFGGLAALLQLAKGDPKEVARLTGAGREFFAAGGAESRDEAFRSTFQLESAGILGDRQLFADLFGIIDIAQVAGSIGKLQASIGKKETGGAAALISKGIVAAGPLAQTSVADILTAVVPSGKAARELGLSDEELIAAVSVAAQEAKSAEVGGTQVQSFLRALGRRGFVEKFKGKSLRQILDVIEEKGLTKPQLIKFLGRTEAEAGFQALRGPLFEERLADVQKGQADNLAIKLAQSRRFVPSLVAQDKRRIELNREELQLSEDAIAQNTADSLRAKQRRLRREQQGVFAASLFDLATGFRESVFGPGATIQDFGEPGGTPRPDRRSADELEADRQRNRNIQAAIDARNAGLEGDSPQIQAIIDHLRSIENNTMQVVP